MNSYGMVALWAGSGLFNAGSEGNSGHMMLGRIPLVASGAAALPHFTQSHPTEEPGSQDPSQPHSSWLSGLREGGPLVNPWVADLLSPGGIGTL